MEFDVLEVHLCHLKHISAIGKEHITTFTVLRHVLVLALLEGFELFGIVALNPTSLVQAHRLPTALGIVFVFQAVLDNFELKLTYRTDNLASIELVDEQLGYPFVHQLVDTLCQLLLLHRVGILDVLEHFRREARQSLEVELFAFGQGVANLEGSDRKSTRLNSSHTS